MSQELVELIMQAYQQPEDEGRAKRVHSCFLRTTLHLPMERSDTNGEPVPLYLREGGQAFLPVFTQTTYFKQWQGDDALPVDIQAFLGRQLVRGVDTTTYLCLDIGQPHYKQFSPEEISHLRKIIQRIDRMAETAGRSQ